MKGFQAQTRLLLRRTTVPWTSASGIFRERKRAEEYRTHPSRWAGSEFRVVEVETERVCDDEIPRDPGWAAYRERKAKEDQAWAEVDAAEAAAKEKS